MSAAFPWNDDNGNYYIDTHGYKVYEKSAAQTSVNQAWMDYWNGKGVKPDTVAPGTIFTGSDQYAPEAPDARAREAAQTFAGFETVVAAGDTSLLDEMGKRNIPIDQYSNALTQNGAKGTFGQGDLVKIPRPRGGMPDTGTGIAEITPYGLRAAGRAGTNALNAAVGQQGGASGASSIFPSAGQYFIPPATPRQVSPSLQQGQLQQGPLIGEKINKTGVGFSGFTFAGRSLVAGSPLIGEHVPPAIAPATTPETVPPITNRLAERVTAITKILATGNLPGTFTQEELKNLESTRPEFVKGNGRRWAQAMGYVYDARTGTWSFSQSEYSRIHSSGGLPALSLPGVSEATADGVSGTPLVYNGSARPYGWSSGMYLDEWINQGANRGTYSYYAPNEVSYTGRATPASLNSIAAGVMNLRLATG